VTEIHPKGKSGNATGRKARGCPQASADAFSAGMSKTVVLIPARYASTRFPGKPLFPLAGKPLVQHVWERARQAKGVDSVIIATDDMRIAEVAFAFGAEVALSSPDCVSGTDRCAEVAARLKKVARIINVQGDEPLVEPRLISKLANTLKKDRTLEMVTAATPFGADEDPANPNAVKVVLNKHSDALYFSRSPVPFLRNGPDFPYLKHLGIYGYTQDFLQRFVQWRTGTLEAAESLEQLRALERGTVIRVVRTKHASIGVDTPEDAAVAEALLSKPSRLQKAAR
jgi:3-deoxy-manno-octulosonate cytidylyltransferase (CMP-KDO synthetase)